MMMRLTGILLLLCAMTLSQTAMISAFTTTPSSTVYHPRATSTSTATSTTSLLLAMNKNSGKPKKTKLTKEELSAMEVRDMTREEMLALNAENERVMNQELSYMTIFSFIISAPLLYLAWVGFFAETAEIAMP